MRSEKEMMNLIINFCINHNDIRALYMNGSRVNKNIKKDKMQDYDIVYVCKDIQNFIQNKNWINYFGDVCIMQEPDISYLFKEENDNSKSYAFLVQFIDGVRIDFTFITIETAQKTIYDDRLVKIIFDKDNILPKVEEASDCDYVLKKPSENEFKDCANEFWWVSCYVAKGLYRGELLYAMDHLNYYVREMLLLMLAYKTGYSVDYKLSFGKNYKFLPKYISKDDYGKLKATYPKLDKKSLWNSLFKSLDFFKELELEVSKLLGFQANLDEINNTYEYIIKIYKDEL
jgi:aminoglycoside 6-adenylyltransferase